MLSFTGRKEEYVDWIRTQIRNIYGWSDRYSESEPGPFSVKGYLKHILEDGNWGDIIVLYDTVRGMSRLLGNAMSALVLV